MLVVNFISIWFRPGRFKRKRRSAMTNVLIADDHTIVRKGLKLVLTESPDPIMVDEACDWQQALAKVHYYNYDLFMMDIAMLNKGGLGELKKLKIRRPKLPILVLSRHPEEQNVERALRAGASGYLTKGSSVDEMVCAIREVTAGGTYFSNSRVENMTKVPTCGYEKTRYWSLTCREHRMIAPVRRTAAAIKPSKDHELVQQRLEEIWGHFPTLREVEECMIETVMKIAGNNQGIAANMLGLKRQTFNMRLKSARNQHGKVMDLQVA